MPRSFALGGHFESFIEEQVRSGRYNNASEVVRDGLRMLEDRENLRHLKIAEIRQSIEESRKDGRTTPADEGTWSVSPADSGHGGLLWTTLRRFGG